MREEREQSLEKEENDLEIPLRPENRFLSLIVRNKKVSQAYKSTIVCLAIGFVTFLSISIAMFASMASIFTITVPYATADTNACLVPGTNCTVTFSIG
jgi:hypothetical protein